MRPFWPSVIAIVSLLVGLLLGVLIVGHQLPSQDGAGTSRAAPLSAPETTREPDRQAANPAPLAQAPVSPGDLLQEFQTNDFAAGQRYYGRFIRVVGEVTAVDASPNEVPFVQLSLRPRPQGSMQALFPASAGQVRDLKKGDHVTLSCSPRYDEDIDNVTLNDCALVK